MDSAVSGAVSGAPGAGAVVFIAIVVVARAIHVPSITITNNINLELAKAPGFYAQVVID